VNEKELREFIQILIKKLKEVHHLTLVYQVGLQFARDYGVSSIDEILESARKSPEILAESEKQFAGLAEVTELTPEDDPSEAVRKWLEGVTPPGKPN
jgi:hypothetical protein